MVGRGAFAVEHPNWIMVGKLMKVSRDMPLAECPHDSK